jgi:hypothetical protein
VKLALLIVASFVVFLVAAKVHGRALRLEREAMGFHSVTFGGANPPEVEALWRADRVRFWPLAGALAALLAGGAFWLTRSPAWAALAALAWGPSLAFFACAILSTLRR